MNRRLFLGSSIAAAAQALAASRFDMSRISFITDEASASPADAIAFAQKYNLQWVELREVPGARKGYDALDAAALKAEASALKSAGLKVAFFNSGGTKYPLPGTMPVDAPKRSEGWQQRAEKEHASRFERLRRQIAAAQAFDVTRLRVFAFARVADTEAIWQRVAETLGELDEVARKEGATLLLENEPACNVGTCAEFASLLRLLPDRILINWDANNGQSMKEKPFPGGYELLPKKRIAHVHMHGRTLLDPEKILDWKSMFAALDKDGYRGCAGLETHYFDGTTIEKSHLCMAELQRITGAKT